MIAGDVINLAKNSELKQLSVAKDTDAVLGYMNLGILEIHKRFPLIQSEAVITMVDGKYSYLLDGTDSDVAIDLSKNSLLMIDEAYNSVNTPLGVNNEEDFFSVTTPEYNLVEIPEDLLIVGDTISLIYRASPNFIPDEFSNVPLPPQFLEGLIHYIGYRGHASVRSDAKFENNTHYMRFEKSMNTIQEKGLFAEDSLASNKFDSRGFI